MSILESCIEEIFRDNELSDEKDFFKESYDYKNIVSERSNEIYSESFGVNYGKDYYKAIDQELEETKEEEKEESYRLIKYDEDIYTSLVELSNDQDVIKYIKGVLCRPIIYNTKVININLPDNTKEKKCIIQGGFIFNLEYYIDEDRDVIHASKFILPFSKIIIIPIETDIGIKISIKIEDYYLKVISLNGLMLSTTSLFIIYDKENRENI